MERGVDTWTPPEQDEQPDEQSSARPFWSGTISFGLVSIPANLFPGNRSSRLGLRMLAPDGLPVGRRYCSSTTGRELEPDQMVRGYEIEKDKYIVVTDEELERLAPDKSRDIDLRRFVKREAIPPFYFERGYFLAPGGESSKAYQLLAAVMEKTGRAGVATFVMRGKEYLIAIVSENGILCAETMRFQDELRSPEDIGLPEKSKVSGEQIHRFEQLVKQKSANQLSRDELHDETAASLLEIVKEKQNHKENVIETGEAKEAEQPDFLETLRASLAGHAGSRTKRRAKRAPAERAERRQPSRGRSPHGRTARPSRTAAKRG